MSSPNQPQAATTDDLKAYVRQLRQSIETAHDRIDELEAETREQAAAIETLREERDDLRAELDQRTSLLQHVQSATALTKDERAAVLIQTLYNQARRNDDRAALDANQAQAALGGDVERTLMYPTMDRAEVLVGDDETLWVEREPRGSDRNTRLVLDLDAGSLPQTVAGYDVGGGARGP